jgi:hypothetical protein
MIAVTQPRRVAALTVARRVAEERGVQLGEEVRGGGGLLSRSAMGHVCECSGTRTSLPLTLCKSLLQTKLVLSAQSSGLAGL